MIVHVAWISEEIPTLLQCIYPKPEPDSFLVEPPLINHHREYSPSWDVEEEINS